MYKLNDLKSLRQCTISEIKYNNVYYCTKDFVWYIMYNGKGYGIMKIDENQLLYFETENMFKSLSDCIKYLNEKEK